MPTLAHHVTPRTETGRFALGEILLIVDWGSSPVNLIHWAYALSGPGTHVSVMCILDSERAAPARLPSGRSRSVDSKWRQTSHRVVAQTCAQLRAQGVAADPIYRDGSPTEAALWAAAERSADLVIANASFADEFQAPALRTMKHVGSTSFLFVRGSPGKRSILLADDFTAASQEARVFSTYVSEHLNVPLRVAAEHERVIAQPEQSNPIMAEILGKQAPTSTTADEIIRLAADQDAQLVIVGNNRRGPLRRLLFGSVSDDVAHRAATSVLVATPRSERP